MSKKKIKPCPFYGAAAEYSDEMGAIMCSGCGFYFECPTTLDDALATWNMRGGELIPKKPKTRKIKAWVGIRNGEIIYIETHITGTSAFMMKPEEIHPCTITINTKHLKGGK